MRETFQESAQSRETFLGRELLKHVQQASHARQVDVPYCLGLIAQGARMNIAGQRNTSDAMMILAGFGLAEPVMAGIKNYKLDEQNRYLETALHCAFMGYQKFLGKTQGSDSDDVSDYPMVVSILAHAPCIQDKSVSLDIRNRAGYSAFDIITAMFTEGVVVEGGRLERTPGIEGTYKTMFEAAVRQDGQTSLLDRSIDFLIERDNQKAVNHTRNLLREYTK